MGPAATKYRIWLLCRTNTVRVYNWVFGLAIDSPAKAVAKSVSDFGINYPIARVDEKVVTQWGASAVPATYLINEKEGTIVWSTKGVTRKKLQEMVDMYLFSTK